MEAVTTPVSEDDWKAGRLWPSIAELYGPTKIQSYEHYLHALTRLKPTPLMIYYVGIFRAGCPPTAVVSSRRLPAFVEYTRFCPQTNPLFRDMLSQAEGRMGLVPGCNSPFRPNQAAKGCSLSNCAMIHDTTDGQVYVADLRAARKLVEYQKGQPFAETVAAVLGTNTP